MASDAAVMIVGSSPRMNQTWCGLTISANLPINGRVQLVAWMKDAGKSTRTLLSAGPYSLARTEPVDNTRRLFLRPGKNVFQT
jgi:hypothetical protein